MQKKRFVLFMVAFAALALASFAAPVTVAFVDGLVQLQSGSGWVALDFGDKFDSAQSVKLAKGGILELTTHTGATVTISAAGTYVVDALIAKKPETGAIATIAAKLDKLAKGTDTGSTVAGVRGDAADQGDLMWAGSIFDAEAEFSAGSDAARAGDYDTAWKSFMAAIPLYKDAGDPYGAARSAWHASLAGLAGGSGAKALASLRAADAADSGALKGQYALALATLSARYGDAAAAKALLQNALKDKWFDDPSLEADAKALLSGL